MSGFEHQNTRATLATTDSEDAPGPAADGAEAGALPSRYSRLATLGKGGMAEVWRVRDQVLGRDLAMKVIGWQLAEDQRKRLRFVAEANLCARLQHPNIVPVHDRGELPDGRLWFTMPEVRGRTLETLIAALHLASTGGAWQGAPDGTSLRGLLGALTSTARAVSYAHSIGVLHRDLKPSNIMIGAFGEVQVMDWGVAAVFEGDEQGAPRLRDAEVSGTPAYMAPEQASGRAALQGPPVDVYALGAILYTLLAGRPPLAGGQAALAALRQGPPPSIYKRLRADHPPLPTDLARLTERAMSRDPAERPSAAELADELTAWLDGAKRRDRARALVTEAEAMALNLSALRGQASSLRAGAAEVLSALPPRAPAEQKAQGWAMDERAEALELEATLTETRWLETLRVALEHEPELAEAHAALADHHQQKMAAAEAARDGAAVARHEVLLRAHDRGRHAGWLRNQGWLTVLTDPPGARATLHRVRPALRRLEPVYERDASPPIRALQLEAGSWVLRLQAEGCERVDLPVLIRRGEHADGVRPGDAEPRPLRLPRIGELGPEDHLVPGGWCLLGGDPDAMDPLPLQRWWIDALVVRRHPVTLGEHLTFLNALVAAGRLEEALALAPCERATSTAGDHRHVALGPDGALVLARDGRGEPLRPDLPVTWLDHAGARAYAAWVAETTGQPWRLLHDLEREKLSRGADGRPFPWGDTFDETWACTLHSHEGPPRRAPVQAFPGDVGPYGVRGLAGNVRDWCLNAYSKTGEGEGGLLFVRPDAPATGYMVARGGTFRGDAPYARAASRVAALPTEHLGAVGLRLCRPWI